MPKYSEITTLGTLVEALSNVTDINEQNEIWSKVDNPFVSISPDGFCDLVFVYRGNSDTKKVELISSVCDPSMQRFGQFELIQNDIWIMPIKHIPNNARISFQDKSRKYWIHIPPTDPEYSGSYKLLVHLDGYETIKRMKAPAIMEQAMQEHKIKPTITVYIDSGDRNIEYGCGSEAELFADFVAADFVGKICNDYPEISKDPSDITIAGFSMGGNGAAHIATMHPEVFGNVISQSGSYWMGSMTSHGFEPIEGLHYKLKDEHYPKNEADRQQCFYLNVGQLETGVYSQAPSGEQIVGVGITQVDANEHFFAFLKNKNISCRLDIYPGDHCFAEWQNQLIDGLVWINQKRMMHYYKDSVEHKTADKIIIEDASIDSFGDDENVSASSLKTGLKK